MTIIEFFDTTHIDNLVSTLLFNPDKVIFVGDNLKKMKRCSQNYLSVIREKNLKTEFHFCSVSRNNLSGIITSLSKIIENEDECIFDLDGGEDLYLVAVGILSQKYGSKVQMHRYNVRNGMLNDCDSDGNCQLQQPIHLSVEDNIAVYGGKVMTNDNSENVTCEWIFDDDFISDINLMWDICSDDSGFWNAQINCLDMLFKTFGNEDSLTLTFNKDNAVSALKDKNRKLVLVYRFFKRLKGLGLITEYTDKSDSVTITFKNEQVKKVLSKAGLILELKITVTALSLYENDGTPVYNDVRTGVYIDWDGKNDGDVDIVNEIDVILMKNLIPIFISCKNGQIEIDELYKLNTVAERFGGKYAKRVLIASEIDKMGKVGEYLKLRASEMGIRVIEDVDSMEETELKKAVLNLYKC